MNETHCLKIVLLGASATGKTSIANRYVKENFLDYSEPTIGAAFHSKSVQTNVGIIKFEIWDTAGQERYRSLTPLYYRNATVALVVFDITNKNTFLSAKMYIDELNSYHPYIHILLIGNKYDLPFLTIDEDEILDFVNKNNLIYFKTSAKQNLNVNNIFNKIIDLLTQNLIFLKKKENIEIEQKKNKFFFNYCLL